ncbi:ABC transporter-related protein [Calothrix parasitica NIES-267]|uniref:ABC transporter-related protein n=1 Tax=Calothrix parasitica NIES-267 TaxID=1973488 RepID=A0A1Z4LIE2_9CYAN|nr:ABC transporter-related protein [Calothrix parasitica NIES-267]
MTSRATENHSASSEMKDDDTIISIQGVSKKFCRSLKQAYVYGLKDIAAEVFGTSRASDKLRKKEFWALRNVSIDVRKGESLGLIGVNGSGKTTLLRIISGLIKPDTGSVRIRGRVAALIALGAGFNPLLSGRENVYVNMSILGLSRQEIEDCFQDVLDFAEVWDAIDAPVRTYSSGMRARLGFACAIYTKPDILLIDEVLAVGDFKFRTKCYRKLAEIRKSGVSFILVSHSTSAILSNCDSAAYLSKGKLVINSNTKEVVKRYEEDLSIGKSRKVEIVQNELLIHGESASKDLKIKSLSFRDAEDKILKTLVTGQPAYLLVKCEAYEKLEDVSFTVMIRSISDRESCFLFIKSANDIGFIQISPGEFTVKLQLPYCGLLTGAYSMKMNVTANGSFFNILDIVESYRFKVKGNENITQSSFYQPRKWDISCI